MRRELWLVLIVAALAGVSVRATVADAAAAPASVSQLPNTVPTPLERYLGIVADYREGRVAQAVTLLLVWPEREVRAARQALVDLAGPEGARLADEEGPTSGPTGQPTTRWLSTRVVLGAILVHLEAAFVAWVERDDQAAWGVHWGSARWLTEWLARCIADRPATLGASLVGDAPGQVFVLMAEWALGQWLLETAEDSATLAVRHAPRDTEALFVSGAVVEARALRGELELRVLPHQAGRRGMNRMVHEAWVHAARNQAAGVYRQVLDLRPMDTAARLRLARVEMLEKHDAVALPHLRDVVTSGSLDERYLAHLFLGETAERSGRLSEALAEYRQAVALRPGAQAARVALAYAMEQAGERDVRPVLRVFADLPAPRPIADDPWWAYPFGGLERADQHRDRLRTLVAIR